MTLSKIEEINNPIVFIFIALTLSSVCYGLIPDYRGLSIFIVVLFFIFILVECGYKFLIIIMMFFICGVFINTAYYSVPEEVNGIIRINKNTSFSTIAEYKGKRVLIDINNKNIEFKEGERYYIKGKLEKKCEKFKGIVGNISKIEEMQGVEQDFVSKLYGVREKIYLKLKENLGSRKAGLVSSMSFGDSKYLDSEDKEDMKNFGIIHSVCVSGLHVAIVYGFLRLFLGERGALLVSIIYVIFTGANYSSIRAFVMLFASSSAEIFHKNKNSISSLCLSGIILIIYKPYSIFEISFHLSYLATLGIIKLSRKINDTLYKLPGKIRESLCITISAQVFTFPYLLIVFNEFSTNFIIGNLLLVPFVNIIVILGNISLMFYRIPFIFNYISYILLKVINLFDYLIDKLELYSMPVFYGNEGAVLFYIFLIISIYFIKRGYNEFKKLPLIAAIVAVVIQLYTPVLTIRYYNEGVLAISYKFERIVISNKNQINIEKYLKLNNTLKEYRKFNKIYIDDICTIQPKNKDYELNLKNKKYLLKMSTSKNVYKDYDIINFKEGYANKIYIINNKVIASF